MKLREVILKAIESDDSYSETNELRIIKRYKQSKSGGLYRELLDYIFIQLCGYSLETLIKKSKEGVK